MDRDEQQYGPGIVLGAIAMVAAMVEALAGLALALAPLTALAAVAVEPRTAYVGTVLAGAGALTLVWILRERPLLALPILIGWPIPTYFALRDHVSDLGLAFHGEAMAHYFVGFLAAGAGAVVLRRWWSRSASGRWRFAVVGLGSIGLSTLTVAHATEGHGMAPAIVDMLHRIGAASWLATWPVALAISWRALANHRIRWPATILAATWLLRILLAGQDGIVGASLPATRVAWLGGAIVFSSIALGFVYRPRVPVWIRIGLAIAVAWLCLSLRGLYDRQFGRLEGAFAGMLESFLGFALPYPAYVADWQASLMTVAFFFVITTVATALISPDDRRSGVALMLMTLGGLGLSSPHLALLVGTGALLLIEDGLDPGESVTAVPRPPIRPFAAEFARTLGLEPPVVLDDESLVAVDGSIDGCPISWRAQARRDSWEVRLSIGVIGHGRPEVRLTPNRGKARSDRDALSRSHRVSGAVRILESYGEPLLSVLSALPRAEVALYAAGARLVIVVHGSDDAIEPETFCRFTHLVVDEIGRR